MGLLVEAFIAQVIDSSDSKHAKHDTEIRKKKALRDPIVWFTGLLFIATACSVVVLALQWRTLEKTDRTLNATLIATTRPWIEPDKIAVRDFEITQSYELIANIDVSYLNVGHSPAHNVYMHAAISAERGGVADALVECSRDPPKKLPYTVNSVFPAQGDSDGANLHLSHLDGIKPHGTPQRYLSFAISGCIIYIFDGSDEPHRTTFAANLWRKKDRPAKGNEGGVGIDALAVGYVDPEDLEVQFVDVGRSAN
jgi:hypothetical protein